MTNIASNDPGEPDTRDRVVYPDPGDLGGDITDIDAWMLDPNYTSLFQPSDTLPLAILNPGLHDWAMRIWLDTGIPPEFHSVAHLTPIEWAALPVPVTPLPDPAPFYANNHDALMDLYLTCQNALTRAEKQKLSPVLAQVGVYLGVLTPTQLPAE